MRARGHLASWCRYALPNLEQREEGKKKDRKKKKKKDRKKKKKRKTKKSKRNKDQRG